MLRTAGDAHHQSARPALIWPCRASVFVLLISLCTSACVTLKRPRGDWAQALDLPIDKAQMQSTAIGVECASSRANQEKWHVASLDACRRIVRIIQDMGAKVLAAAALMPRQTAPDGDDSNGDEAQDDGNGDNAPQADFSVRYIDRGGSRDYCGWTAPLFLIFAGFFPCIEDISTAAELQILDKDGIVFQKKSMRLEMKGVYGVPALYLKAREWLDPRPYKERQEELVNNLAQYVRDLVYTYRIRQMLATGGKQ